MKYLLCSVVLAAALGGQAQATEPTIESACIRAAAAMSVAPTVIADVVQSFPELDPPRAKIRFRFPTSPEGQVFFLTCNFKRASAPFEMTEFCNHNGCFNAKAKDPKMKALYEEVSTVLQREGL